MSRSYYLVSTTDNRAVEIFDDPDCGPSTSQMRIASAPCLHEAGCGRFANTLRDDLVREAERMAKISGFEVDTDSMLVK